MVVVGIISAAMVVVVLALIIASTVRAAFDAEGCD